MNKISENIATEAGKKGAARAIDLVVDRFILPHLEKICSAPKDIFILHELFKEYLNKKYESDKYMNTIVFHDTNKTITDLYIPLTIVQSGRKGKITVDENMKNIFDDPNKMLIIDTAGTGKSTIVKFLSLLCITKEWGYPFVIELRRLEKEQSIEEYVIKGIKLNSDKIADVDVKDVLKRGRFIFFLDGYDEILEENKAYVTKAMREFMVDADENSFIITSREDNSLSEFSDFIKYKIKPLNKDEAYELIRKYDENGVVSEALINEIEKNKNYEALKEFLGNPLMVSLLYLTYRYKGVLQYKKHIFYRQVFDALYDRHDSLKGVGAKHEKKSKLDIEDFRRVLCAMGFISMKQGMVEFDKDQIMELITQALKVFPEINADKNMFLNDILYAVPLFVEEGINFKWAHKSFAEYFAAVFICKECSDCEEQILAQILLTDNNQRFYNMLDFCYDMDYKAVTNNIVYPILCEFITFYENAVGDKSTELFDVKVFLKFICESFLIKIEDKPQPKDRDIINDFIKAVNLFQNEVGENWSIISYLSKSENVILLSKHNHFYELIKLMYRKELDIFFSPRVKTYPLKFLKDLRVGTSKVLDNSRYYEIIQNNEDAITSAVFHNDSDFDAHILDIEKCKKRVQTIEDERKRVNPDFFSLI